ncbi:putative F-box/LRR-repeat protein 9 isoform X2 [Carya illinoinensis]|uniref:putative F-box/LRR-repeat protein 9 isoform X2 n=1 Tax=Carya illinoinensis TaxID=32201 RepID=UPI001C728746|nr:putative F-box/LRR-repeat protein 9 isoform X2 [Carya illinoinensis]
MITLSKQPQLFQKEKPLAVMEPPPPAPPPPPPPHPLPEEQYRNWLDLPQEVTESILKRLGVIEILTSAQKVCLLWRKICKGPSMWRTINMAAYRDYDLMAAYLDSWSMPYDVEDMCRHAIDLSCGQLVGITLGPFCTDDLLNSSELRYLGLSGCYKISAKGFSEAAANIPLLDKLELAYFGTENFLEAVGRSCPILKSLTLIRSVVCWDPFKGCDLSAVAISENMPGLVSLLLVGNKLTNDGLQAILDGCPHLQSLELLRCRHVSMEGDFARKCSERIKNLRFHYFSDQEFRKILEDGGYYDEDETNDCENFGLEYTNDW